MATRALVLGKLCKESARPPIWNQVWVKLFEWVNGEREMWKTNLEMLLRCWKTSLWHPQWSQGTLPLQQVPESHASTRTRVPDPGSSLHQCLVFSQGHVLARLVQVCMWQMSSPWLEQHAVEEWQYDIWACRNIGRSACLCWCIWTYQRDWDVAWSQGQKLGVNSFPHYRLWWSQWSLGTHIVNIGEPPQTHPCTWNILQEYVVWVIAFEFHCGNGIDCFELADNWMRPSHLDIVGY